MIAFSLLLIVVLFIPGHLVSTMMGIREYQYLSSVMFSFLVLLLCSAVAGYLGFSAGGVGILVAVSIVILFVAVLVGCRAGWFDFRCSKAQWFSSTIDATTIAVIIFSVLLYHFIFGIYDEVPSDLIQHLVLINREIPKLEDGLLFGFKDMMGLRYAGEYWYFLMAWLTFLSSASLAEVYSATIVINTIVFLVALALVADRLFQVLGFARRQHQVAILLAVFFVFSQMGINVISFVRYYSHGPTIINFVIYFSALVCLLDLMEGKVRVTKAVFLIAVAGYTSYLLHEQEALFIFLAGLLLAIWKCGELIWAGWKNRSVSTWKPLVSLLLLITACFTVFIYVHGEHGFGKLYSSRVIPLPVSLPYIGKLHILNPEYQFIQVVTIWGIAVYVLSAVYLKKLAKQPFLVMGLLSPLLTVFNPMFVDIFIRLDNPTTLWRLCYFIPLHFVASVLVVMLWLSIKRASGWRRAAPIGGIASLFLLLLPAIGPIPLNAYAKSTLSEVPAENRIKYWEDVIEFMESQDKPVKVLTDPITGYLLAAFTGHRSNQDKFLPDQSYYRQPFVFESYSSYPLDRYKGRLILVNNRNGGPSRTGEFSKHWSRDVLRLTDYYSEELVEHLESNPEQFRKLWGQNKVTVYLIL